LRMLHGVFPLSSAQDMLKCRSRTRMVENLSCLYPIEIPKVCSILERILGSRLSTRGTP
jgi:hypothetical protein